MKYLTLIILLALAPLSWGEPIDFKCSIKGYPSDERNVSVDLDSKTLKIGDTEYKITTVDPVWITATKAGDPGGDVYVQNRYSGEWIEVGIGRYCGDSDCEWTEVRAGQDLGGVCSKVERMF